LTDTNPTEPAHDDANDVWRQILAPYIVSGPDANGEYKAHCPIHEDRNPSASFNFAKQMYICRSQCGGGNLDDLRWRARNAFDRWAAGGADGWPESAYWAPWNRTYNGSGGAKSGEAEPLPSNGAIAGCIAALLNRPERVDYLRTQRGLTNETIRERKVGWSIAKNAYIIPIHDAAGGLVNVRYYKPKTPRMEKAGRWGVTGHNEPRLYPVDVLESATSIVVCAGEWDALVLNQHGIPAVTSTGGETGWKSEWNDLFRDKHVRLVYDCDKAGRAGAAKVAHNLTPVAKELRIVDLDPERSDGFDVTDWFVKEKKSVADFKKLLNMKPDEKSPTGDGFPQTDYGNAERLIARHGKDIRYCPPWKRWLIWDGKRWCRDETEQIERMAKDTVRNIVKAAVAVADVKQRDKLITFGLRSEMIGRLKAMIDLAASEIAVPVLPMELDASPMLLNVLNGTIDLADGSLHGHRREDLLTKLAPVAYDPKALCPRWDKFLRRVLPSEELRTFLQRAVGYSLTGDTSEEVAFLLYGMGANGKSKFLETVRAASGSYAQAAPSELLLTRRQGGATNDVARQQGARFVTSVETGEGRELAEALFKQLTGQDTIPARYLYGEWFEFSPACKLWLATNHKPEIRETTPALWRRIHLIPFTVQIPKVEQDRRLGAKLRFELPGILTWAVEGCAAWQKDGLAVPAQVTEATEEYRRDMDVIGRFMEDHCVVGPANRAPAGDLYNRYETWCSHEGIRIPMTQNRFGRKLTERGFKRERVGRDKVHTWVGIGLLHGGGASALRMVRDQDDTQ